MPGSPPRRLPETIAAQLREYAAQFPDRAQLRELGTTHEGRPILGLAVATGLQADDPRPVIILNGAHHGGELISVDVVLDAIDVLLQKKAEKLAGRVARILESLVVICVPEVNPDGVQAVLKGLPRSDRKNARDNNDNDKVDAADGVDLNRNYPFRWGALREKGSSSNPKSVYYRGPSAASEPEVQALMALYDEERPVGSISYHTGTVALLAPYTIPGVKNPEPNEAWSVGEWLGSRMPHHPQDRDFTLKKNLYPVDGTDQDYFRHAFGTVALLIESARSTPSSSAEREAIVQVVRNSWLLLCERFLDGPSLSGTVSNAAGEPVVAELRIVEQTLHEGEVWTSRARDGRFARYVPRKGRYTVRAIVEGQPPVEEVVEVDGGGVEVALVIPGAGSG